MQDPEFFEFYRSMQSYRTALGETGTTMVLSPDSEFFRYFGGNPGVNVGNTATGNHGATPIDLAPAAAAARRCRRAGSAAEPARPRRAAAAGGRTGRRPSASRRWHSPPASKDCLCRVPEQMKRRWRGVHGAAGFNHSCGGLACAGADLFSCGSVRG